MVKLEPDWVSAVRVQESEYSWEVIVYTSSELLEEFVSASY